MLYSHEQLYIHIYMQKHNDAITSRHSSLEKYTSHFIERVVCERELETEQKLQYIDPQLFWLPQPFFPVLLGCSTGGLWSQPLLGHGSHSSIFSPTHLNFLSPGLYNNNFSCEHHNSHSIQPLDSQGCSWYLQPDAPVIYTGAFLLLTAWPDRRSICNKITKFWT